VDGSGGQNRAGRRRGGKGADAESPDDGERRQLGDGGVEPAKGQADKAVAGSLHATKVRIRLPDSCLLNP
jgi:hypothetical protein